jgi:endonuclease/exonuclease/phosphatase family metal-dependent hydrolase
MSELALALLTIHGIAAGVVVTFFGYRLLRDRDAIGPIGPRGLAAPLLLTLTGVAIVFTSLFLGLRPPTGLIKPEEREPGVAQGAPQQPEPPTPAPAPERAAREAAPDVRGPSVRQRVTAPTAEPLIMFASDDEVSVTGDREAVPEDMLALVSWNIQTGGTSVSSTATRPPMVRDTLKRMLGGTFQIIAAQEIPSQPSSQLLVGLLPEESGPWQQAFVDTTSTMDNGFWFQTDTATLNRNEVLFTTDDKDAQGRLVRDEDRAFHPPHVAHFTVGDFDFTIITLHLTFQGGAAEESRREMAVVLDYLTEYFDTEGHDPDVIICGDFNLPSFASGETADGLTLDQIIEDDGRFSDTLRRLHVFVDEKTSRSPVSGGGLPSRNYDHFVLSEDCLEEFVSARRFAPEILTDDPRDPEETRTSDHFPIVAIFRTSGENVQRDAQ